MKYNTFRPFTIVNHYDRSDLLSPLKTDPVQFKEGFEKGRLRAKAAHFWGKFVSGPGQFFDSWLCAYFKAYFRRALKEPDRFF